MAVLHAAPAIDILQVKVRVLKGQRTLIGDTVEAVRSDGVASGDIRGCWRSGARRERTTPVRTTQSADN
jgi:hypothetical protein